MSEDVIKVISPVDNNAYAVRPMATDEDIKTALKNAVSGQRQWQATEIEQRKTLCLAVVDYLLEHQALLAQELTWQMGRPIRYTPGEINGFAERARYMIDIAQNKLAPIEAEAKDGFTRYISREPLGVVLSIVPWNYPYLTAVNSVIPAIMAGNSVIVKPSSRTPLTAERMAEAFEAAGLPKGVFQYLLLSHEDTQALIKSEHINFVSFTGSVSGGRTVEQGAAGRFIDVGLELGGKDPAYVRPDAVMDFSVENLVDGAFFNSGQSCCAIERIYVHQDVYDNFVEQFVEKVKEYNLGNPRDQAVTLGPVINTDAVERIRQQVKDAQDKGAKACIDTKHFARHRTGTPYLAPQVMINVDHSMRLFTEESFGPVVGIMKVRDDKEAVQRMNHSQFGLTASVWTQDETVAIELGRQVQTGTWFMNRCDYLDPALAWTGVKLSGKGCTLSEVGYEKLTRPKSYHLRSKC